LGGLVGGIFDLAQGDPTQGEQKKFGSMGDYQTGVGEGLTTAGAGFNEDILSGDPTKISQALAPEISFGQGQVEQQRLHDANFGTRSGGTAASTANAEGANRGNIINLVGGLQKSTAESSLSHGGNLMDSASSNIGNEAQLAEQRRQQQVGDVNGIASSVASIATGLPMGGAATTAPAAGQDLLSMASPEDSALESINAMGIS
jgi:hypothetical protein